MIFQTVIYLLLLKISNKFKIIGYKIGRKYSWIFLWKTIMLIDLKLIKLTNKPYLYSPLNKIKNNAKQQNV